MQKLTTFNPNETLDKAIPKLSDDILTVLSSSSGTAFPTDGLQVGMVCYRTDLGKAYVLTSLENNNPVWTILFSIDFAPGVAEFDSSGNEIAKHYLSVDGGAMNGPIKYGTAPSNETELPNKAYVDAAIKSAVDAAIKSAVDKSATEVDAKLSTSYYTKSQTYTKTEVDNRLSNDMPTGTVLAFAGSTVPANYLLCDGSAVSRSTYADLFNVIGTTYGAGDGYSTFKLPNLVNRFVEGGSDGGAVKSAGLPNIRGTFDSMVWSFSDNRLETQGFSSPFSAYKIVDNGEHSNTDWDSSEQGGRRIRVSFNAANANSIYGASTTVQPPAIVMKYIIRI